MGFVLLGCVGGVLPDVIRFFKWTQMGADDPSKIHGATGVAIALRFVGLLIQSALGGFAVYLLGAASPLQAVAIGYAGPEFLIRVLSAAVPKVPATQGVLPQSGTMQLQDAASSHEGRASAVLQWWRL